MNQDFELIELEQAGYDLVYSASAFHWIPVETGIPKVLNILKPDGVFAWFSVQPMPSEEHLHIHNDIQRVYSDYSEYFGKEPAPDPSTRRKQAVQKIKKRCDILERFGFVDIQSNTYCGSRIYNSTDYIQLISTFSNHRVMPEVQKVSFFKSIKDTIDGHGGQFKLDDIFILCMGRKAQRLKENK